MAAVQRPIAVPCIQEKTAAPAWRTRPTWYLIAEEDRMIPLETQRFMAHRINATIRSHKVDHTPMYTAPELVVDTIVAAARETLPK
jgi:pimeloyl-ACP methyl ester carboxylesterase